MLAMLAVIAIFVLAIGGFLSVFLHILMGAFFIFMYLMGLLLIGIADVYYKIKRLVTN